MNIAWTALFFIPLLSSLPDPVRQADLQDLLDRATEPSVDAAEAAWLEAELQRAERFRLSPESPPSQAPESHRRGLQARLTYQRQWFGGAQNQWLLLAEVTIGFGWLSRIGHATPYGPPRTETLRRRRCERLDESADAPVGLWLRAARARALACYEATP